MVKLKLTVVTLRIWDEEKKLKILCFGYMGPRYLRCISRGRAYNDLRFLEAIVIFTAENVCSLGSTVIFYQDVCLTTCISQPPYSYIITPPLT